MMKLLKTKSVFFAVLITTLMSLTAQADADFSNSAAASAALVQAAQDEIDLVNKSGNAQTACDLYLEGVLNLAGFPIGHFLANGLDQAMATHLPTWQVIAFTTDNPGQDQAQLLSFLNSAPDGTAFLAQWPRVGESGHVALVEKVALNQFVIYQAQLGLATPYSRPTKISGLLYPKGPWGDRAHLKLFYK